MSIEVKISKKRVNYKKAMYILEKRVENVKKGLKKEFIWILRTSNNIYWWYSI